MRLEDFKLQKCDWLDVLSGKYIQVSKGRNGRFLYSIIDGSYICTEYYNFGNTESEEPFDTSDSREYKLVGELENYLIYKNDEKYYIYSLITNKVEAECDCYETRTNTGEIETFNLNGETIKTINISGEGESKIEQSDIMIGNLKLSNGNSSLIYYDSVIIVQDYYTAECYMKDGTFIGMMDRVAENKSLIITEKILALHYKNKWKIYDMSDGRDKYHLEFDNVKRYNNCIIAYTGGRYLDIKKNKIVIFDLKGNVIYTFENFYDFSWKLFVNFFELEVGQKKYIFDIRNLKRYEISGKIEGKIYVSDSKWYYVVHNKETNKKGLIDLSKKNGLKEIMPVEYDFIRSLDDFLYGEKDTKSKNACKDIYDWTGKYITTVQKKE